MKAIVLLIFIAFSTYASAVKVFGTISDEKGNLLPFASILVKGTPIGTSANNDGKYFLNLSPGKYVIVAQYVGYQRTEKAIEIKDEDV